MVKQSTVQEVRDYFYQNHMFSELDGFNIGVRLFADNEQKKKTFWQKHKGKILAGAALAGLGGLAYANKDKIGDAVKAFQMRKAVPSGATTPVVPAISEVHAPKKDNDKIQRVALPSGIPVKTEKLSPRNSVKPDPVKPQPEAAADEGTKAEAPAETRNKPLTAEDLASKKRIDNCIKSVANLMGGAPEDERKRVKALEEEAFVCCRDSTSATASDLARLDVAMVNAINKIENADRTTKDKSLRKHYQYLTGSLEWDCEVIRRAIKDLSHPEGTHF